MVRPRRISAARAPVFTTVSVVWTIFASLTPRRLIHVRTQMLMTAISRCGDNPSCTGAPESVKSICGNQAYRSGVMLGQSTPRNFPNATATAAMVPVWITTKRVQP